MSFERKIYYAWITMNEPYYAKHTESFEREVNFSKKLIVSVVYAIIEVFGLCGNVLVI